MSNNSSLENNDLNNKIQTILRQTNYTEEVAREKLKEHNFDEIYTIKNYLGITNDKKTQHITSLNQEIYKQLRYKLKTTTKNEITK